MYRDFLKRLLKTSSLLLVMALPLNGGIAKADVPNVLQDADPTFLESWQSEIRKQTEMLAAAFTLDEDGQKSLQTEFELRLVLQHDYEAKMNAELDELSRKAEAAGAVGNEDSPEMQAIAQRFIDLTNAMPLNESQVVKWVESRVSPEVAQEGQQRWEELIRRRSMVGEAKTQTNEQVTARKSGIAAEVRDMQIRKSAEDGLPLPRGNNGDFVDEETMRRAGRPYLSPADIASARERKGQVSPATAQEDRSGYFPSMPAAGSPSNLPPSAGRPVRPTAETVKPNGPPQPPQPMRLRAPESASPGLPPAVAMPAPPLDEWEKYVITVSQKYGFDSAQNTRAQSILSDLRKRAYQYQLSRSEEFAKTELLTDAKLRGETMKRLNIPLDALFAELKQRLESLPTIAQQQRQGQPPAVKKNK